MVVVGLWSRARGKREASPGDRGGVWRPSLPSSLESLRVPVKTPSRLGGKGPRAPGLGGSLSPYFLIRSAGLQSPCLATLHQKDCREWGHPLARRAVPGWSHRQGRRCQTFAPPLPLRDSSVPQPPSVINYLFTSLSVCLSHQTVSPSGEEGTLLHVASSSNSLAHSRSSENVCGSGKERQGKEGRERGAAGCSRAREGQVARCLGSGPFHLLPHQLAGDTMAPRAWLPGARTLPLPLPMALLLSHFPYGEKALLSDSVSASGFDTIL